MEANFKDLISVLNLLMAKGAAEISNMLIITITITVIIIIIIIMAAATTTTTEEKQNLPIHVLSVV
jgi:hypothetical protein